MSKAKLYFPNLNGLRFIAAFLVILVHLEQVKSILEYPTFQISKNPHLGKLGVIMFFTLSGFLITYLLLTEEKGTGKISIKDFYIRRILRIWPLYFFIIFISFFVLRYIPFFQLPTLIDTYSATSLLLYIIVLPNLALACGFAVPYASHTWSIGVEEQFYIFLPILMKLSKNKERLMIGGMLLYTIIRLLFYIAVHYTPGNKSLAIISSAWEHFNIDCMFLGGLLATWSFKERKIVKKLFNPFLNWIIIIFLVIIFFTKFEIPYFNVQLFSLLFAIVILNLATNPNPIINLETKMLDYLGRISYGLYMYHIAGIMIAIKLLSHIAIHNWLPQIILSISITILLASISYYLFERKFITLKKKYSKIISGDEAKANSRNIIS